MSPEKKAVAFYLTMLTFVVAAQAGVWAVVALNS